MWRELFTYSQRKEKKRSKKREKKLRQLRIICVNQFQDLTKLSAEAHDLMWKVPMPNCAPDPLQYPLWRDRSRHEEPRISDYLIPVKNVSHCFAILNGGNLIEQIKRPIPERPAAPSGREVFERYLFLVSSTAPSRVACVSDA